MDHGSQAPQPGTSLADPDIRCPDLVVSPAYESLCEWFDEQLELLNGRFGTFRTESSAKSAR